MTEYKGFRYWQDKKDHWWLRYPSGFKTKLEVTTEVGVKKLIDELTATTET